MRRRLVMVEFVDLVDDGTAGLGNEDEYKTWITQHLESLRDIRVDKVITADFIKEA